MTSASAPTSAPLDVVTYLASKNIRTFQGNGPEITAWCFFCGRHQRDKGRLYINTVEGVFFCQVCQERGNFNRILEHFGDPPTAVAVGKGDDTLWRRRILNGATTATHTALCANDAALEWLIGHDRAKKQRGLAVETIVAAKLGFINKGWSLIRSTGVADADKHSAGTGLANSDGTDFFRGPKLLIPYLTSGHTVQIRARDWTPNGEAGKYQTGPGEAVRLYNSDALRGADEVIITEGEFDCLVLQQTLAGALDERVRKIAVVGIPGAGAFSSDMAAYFVHVRRVFIALDPDQAGRTGAIRIKETLGTKARIVELPDDLPKCDWTEFLAYRKHTWRDVVALLDKAGRGERMLCGFGEALDAYFDREENGEYVPFGWSCVDSQILGGGVNAGAVAVVAAKTGAGKTIIGCNVIYHNNLLNGLFVSLEMPRADVGERLFKIYRFHHPQAGVDEIRAAYERLSIYDKNRLEGKGFYQLIDEYTEQFGRAPHFIVVDHLNYYARMQRGGSTYEKTTNAIGEIKEVAKEADTSIFVPTQVSRIAKDGHPIESEMMRDSGAIEETADYLLTAWRPDDALDPGNTKERTGALQGALTKNRRGPKDIRFMLSLAHASLALVERGTQASRIAAIENQQYWMGKSYEEIHAHHRQGVLTP